MFGNDDVVVAAHLGKPVAELLGIAHRCRQRDDLYRHWEVNDDLLPHRPAETVGEVMHLVHDNKGKGLQRGGPGIHHVAQHLGRHDDDGSLPID